MKKTNLEILSSIVITYDKSGKGLKLCDQCLKYIGIKSKICFCGNEKFNTNITKKIDNKIIKIYNEPGRGRKQCRICHKYVGVRITHCPCGHKFVKGQAKLPEPKPLEYYKAKAVAEALGYNSGFNYIVYTPCGVCPIKLKKTGKVGDWAEQVIDCGSASGLFYAPSAIKYFGREFYDYHDDKYTKLCRLVDKWVKKLIGTDYKKEEIIEEI